MSGELGTNVPLQIQRQLRKECQYGCAMCGCPLLRYAHIVPYHRIQAFLPENMIPLCPSHYEKYDKGELSDSLLRDAKRNPHNRLHPLDGLLVDAKEMSINVGKCRFIDTYRILVVNDFDLITITRDSGKYILLDINFFDKTNNLIATISENSWVAEKTTEWEI
ncbi:MAG TPA: HNH endonuclease signature motif containing protein, partial [Candidatus Nitrosopolaris sp.]|nr:HNH endonuclease signature motif containing protein [Candidatus Nitrosopolaris sp.]